MHKKTVIGVVVLVLGGCGGSSGGGTDLRAHADLAAADQTSIAVISSILITPAPKSLIVGDSETLVATATYSNATMQDVSTTGTWASSSTAVLTVSPVGEVSAVGDGTVMVTYSLDGVTSPPLVLTVLAVGSVTLTWPGGSSMPTTSVSGANVQLTATAQLSDLSTRDVSANTKTTWLSAMTNVATVDASGLAHPGDNTGTSDISATFDGKTGTETLLVNP